MFIIWWCFVSWATASADQPVPPTSIVERLYSDFNWETRFDGNSSKHETLIEKPLASLLQYFDKDLAALLVHDRKCVVESGEICNLDFSPIWDSQDPEGATVKIGSGGQPNEVQVIVVYGAGAAHLLKYKMKLTNAGWRITDIQSATGGWSLMKLLSPKH
jgi:hypothetical protein